ncbi:putative holin, partial [Enterobacter hormaechei]
GSFIYGVIGAHLVGSYLSICKFYRESNLDALAPVIVDANAIKLQTFLTSQDLGTLFGILSRFRAAGARNGNK